MIGGKSNKQVPEANTPEFIRVVYDEKGNAIAVKPANASVMQNFIPDKTNGTNTVAVGVGGSPQSRFILPAALEQWLTLISKNILVLKSDVERTHAMQNQLFEQIEQIKNLPAPTVTTTQQAVDFSPIVQQIAEQKMLYKLLADQVNTMNEIVDMIAKEFSQQKTFTRELATRMQEINDNFADSFARVKNIETDIESLRSETMQRFSYAEDKTTSMHRQLAASSDRTEADMIALHDVVTVMNERIAEMSEKINALNGIKAEIAEMIEHNRIDVKVDRQLLIEKIVGDVTKRLKTEMRNELKKGMKAKTKIEVKIKVRKLKKRKSSKLHRKLKRKTARKIKRVAKRKIARKIKPRIKPRQIRKITARKINKTALMKKLVKSEITSYGNALVVTEKKAAKYGRAVFDMAKNMNENVVLIMQDKLSEADGFEQITYDAIDSSEAVFIVTPRKMKKNFAVRNASLTRRVFLVDKKLKFVEVKY